METQQSIIKTPRRVNPAFSKEVKKRFGGEAIATLINSREGKALKEFGGVIFVRADSPIKTLEDIKGKRFMCVKKSSFGGYQMALRTLKQHGIDPEKEHSTPSPPEEDSFR